MTGIDIYIFNEIDIDKLWEHQNKPFMYLITFQFSGVLIALYIHSFRLYVLEIIIIIDLHLQI